MGRSLGESAAAAVKVNIGYQFIRLTSGEITLGQFLQYAIFRPLKYFLIFLLGFPAILIAGFEVYSWTFGESFIYQWATGWKDSKSPQKAISLQPTDKKHAEANSKVMPAKVPAVAVSDEPAKNASEPKLTSTMSDKVAHSDKADSYPSDMICKGLNLSEASDRGQCEGRLHGEWKRVDDQLNVEYRAAMGNLNMEQKARLRTDEIKWIRTRDKTCDSLSQVHQNNCRIDFTNERIAFLKSYRPD
jgi:uncharacterized protein YecT (DUF1311 family)